MTIAPVLTIAGSDSSGGAGVQADLKTMTMLGCFGMSAITALTAQNTLGVQGICPVPAEFLKQQIAAVCEDISPAAVKVGMVYDTPQILAIAEAVAQYQLPHVVVDPVMVATSGDPLLKQQAQQALTEQLFPLAELLTPNLPEAEQLTGTSITSPPQMEQAARQLSETYHTAVLLKGGHSVGSCNDLLYAHCHVVFRTADGYPQHPRHRLHPVLGDGIFSGTGGFAGRKRPPRKGVHQQCYCGRLVTGTRTRTDCT